MPLVNENPPVLIAGADSVSNAIHQPMKAGFGYVYSEGGSDWDRMRSVEAEDDVIAGLLAQGGYVYDGIAGNWNRSRDAFSITDATGGTGFPIAAPMSWNGTTWDRHRGNTEGTALASAARTASTTSATLTNYNSRGLVLSLDVTATAATPSITVGVDILQPVSSAWRRVYTAAVAVTATGRADYQLGPGTDAAALGGYTDGENIWIPRSFRVAVDHADADSITYSVGFALIH